MPRASTPAHCWLHVYCDGVFLSLSNQTATALVCMHVCPQQAVWRWFRCMDSHGKYINDIYFKRLGKVEKWTKPFNIKINQRKTAVTVLSSLVPSTHARTHARTHPHAYKDRKISIKLENQPILYLKQAHPRISRHPRDVHKKMTHNDARKGMFCNMQTAHL